MSPNERWRLFLPTTVVGSYSVPEWLERLKTEYYQRRIYTDPAGLVRALARRLNLEARSLADAGAAFLQIDEPFLAGYPEQAEIAVEAVNIVTDGVPVTWALHVCYGNRHARPSWEGHYDFLFPAVLAAHVDQLVLEFAREGLEDLRLIREYSWQAALGLGVIDVKSPTVETPELVAARIRRAFEYVDPGRLMINPDCGLRQLTPEVARRKLHAMVAGTAIVRSELSLPHPAENAPASAPASGGSDSLYLRRKQWKADSSSLPSR
jgi:5-methyltetrahydropteroyltriglutamate--homocysteine methyltransferase